MRAYLADLREGVRILASREFWQAFRAYWHPDAVADRLDKRLRDALRDRDLLP